MKIQFLREADTFLEKQPFSEHNLDFVLAS